MRGLTNAGVISVSTVVQKWNADPDFTPLTAAEFLKPKTQAKWESLIPSEKLDHRMPAICFLAITD